jgi:[acyl-carrier-protein] S-malonyltransferase
MKTAFLFPGQGSQAIGMGKLAHDRSSAAHALFEKADKILGFPLTKFMFEGPEEKLRETIVTQPALFVASAAALELLKEKGLEAQAAAGHSLGEYSALYAAGVFSFEDALRMVSERGKAMQQSADDQPGTMAAILGLAPQKIQDICAQVTASVGVCAMANFNSESQIVISGEVDAIKKAMELCTQAGALKAIQLNVSGAFHSPLMSPAAVKMKAVIDPLVFQNAKIPVYTNVDAAPTQDAALFKTKLVQQIDHSVRWDETLKAMNTAGFETFIEVGSGKVLSSMVKKLDRKKTTFNTDDFDSLEKGDLNALKR